MINKLKARWRDWQEQRFLKKHACKTRTEYNRRYDTDFCHHASDIKRKYHGYEFVHCFSSYMDYAYKTIYNYGPGGYRQGYHDLEEWCEKHCTGKFRADVLRVFWDRWTNDWRENEIGGSDYVFFAFKEETDYMNFLLQWSGVRR